MPDAGPPTGTRPAPAGHPVHELIRDRWSPRAYSGEAVPEGTLLSVLEAARWAPSSFNEQPWRMVVAPRGDTARFRAFFECLTTSNKRWLDRAALLMLGAVQLVRDRDGAENRYAHHDLGAAWTCAALQAVACGAQMHILGGFDKDAIARVCAVPDGFAPVSMAALGIPGDPANLPDDLRAREIGPRRRHPLEQIAFGGTWGGPLPGQ